mmetsp:Transcript_20213/g.45979  ORF Transcript_20213/g.45979 Transcript_20213/m.45979 type:complete len:293 (+) Transcript_20213:1121-1999(+)
MLGSRCIRSQEGKVDVSARSGRKLTLGFLSGFSQTLDNKVILGNIHASLLLELSNQVRENGLIEILSTKMGVTVGRLHFEHATVHLQNRHIEGTTAKVINSHDLSVTLLVHSICKSCCSRLVDNTQNLEARDLSSILGGLSLRIVEVCRDSDYCLVHRGAKIALSSLLHLLQDERSNLRWRILLSILRLNPCISVCCLDNLERTMLDILFQSGISKLSSNQTLCCIEGVVRVRDCLSLGWHTHQHRSIFLEGNNRRSCSGAFGILNHFRCLLSFHQSNAGVGGSQIHADHVS